MECYMDRKNTGHKVVQGNLGQEEPLGFLSSCSQGLGSHWS